MESFIGKFGHVLLMILGALWVLWVLRVLQALPLIGRLFCGGPRSRLRKKERRKGHCSDTDFYRSLKWRELRYRVLRKYGRECMLCGAKDRRVHVDHIKPRSKYPHLALEESNLQVLCFECNYGKSNKYEDDFRRSQKKARRA